MRPAGEVSAVILQAASALAGSGQPGTLREIAQHACVGVDAARKTISNLCRAGRLEKRGERRVEYRNRPVTEYAPAIPKPDRVDLATAINTWQR